MFWRAFTPSARSAIEQVLDRTSFTLEDLLDEEDLVQECCSLNARLLEFLRQKENVQQLVRYMVEPPDDPSDPKRTYKYPFTACEVLCCELEGVYTTLLEDSDLLRLLFGLLDSPPPLRTQTAGYFGRVVGNLLLRKNSEMLDWLQAQGPELLIKLVRHIATTSIADVIKRMIGADDQSSLVPSPAMGRWLADTPLVDLLLSQLDQGASPEAQANTADILAATAHTQPSALATRLSEPGTVATLVGHALAPSRQVLLPALDVCIALLEPRRIVLGASGDVGLSGEQEAAQRAPRDAVAALVVHVPRLVDSLSTEHSAGTSLDTTYGRLVPPLGRHRLKMVELLAVLVRSGGAVAEPAIIQSGALQRCMQLFAAYPFNNTLHHSVAVMLVSSLSSHSAAMAAHIFEECKVLEWLMSLPSNVTPAPRVGDEELAAAKAPLRAGYMGHVTQLALALSAQLAQAASEASNSGETDESVSPLSKYANGCEGWSKYMEEVTVPQQELENTESWACGRPPPPVVPGMESDGDDFSSFEESLMDDLDKMGGQADSNPWSEGEVALVPETAEQHSPLDASEAFLRGAAGLGGQSPDTWETLADGNGAAVDEAGSSGALDAFAGAMDAALASTPDETDNEPPSAGSPMMVEPTAPVSTRES